MKARGIITNGDPELVGGFAAFNSEVRVPVSRIETGYRGYVAFADVLERPLASDQAQP